MSEATGGGIETSEHIPVFVDVAGPRGEDGFRPVVTMRLCINIQGGVFRYEDGAWHLTAKGRRQGFIPLTKARPRANGRPEYLSDRCRAIAEADERRAADRKADDEYERSVARARKNGTPKPTRAKTEDVLDAERALADRARKQADLKGAHPPAADAPPDPPGFGDASEDI